MAVLVTGRLVNFIGFQVAWFTCVLGAANGMPALGPIVVAVVLAVNLAARRRRVPLLALAAAAAALGYVADSALVIGGVMTFPPGAGLGGPSALWMVALWANLAATLDSSMRWMRGRPLVAALFGAAGGPLAYWAGARLGAVEIGLTPVVSYTAIALAWTVSMPVLVALEGMFAPSSRSSSDAMRSARPAPEGAAS